MMMVDPHGGKSLLLTCLRVNHDLRGCVLLMHVEEREVFLEVGLGKAEGFGVCCCGEHKGLVLLVLRQVSHDLRDFF